MRGSGLVEARRAVLVAAFALVLALLAGCGGGASNSAGNVASGTEGTPGTGGTQSDPAAWKAALSERLGTAPGSVYCAAGYEPNALDRIDATTDAEDAQWEVGYPLKWVAMKPDGSEVWCTPLNWDSHIGVLDNPIAVLDPRTGKVIASVEANHPGKVAFSPDGTKAYVALVLDDAVAVYDTATRAEVDRIAVGEHPIGIAVSFDGERAYVTHGSATVGKASQTTVGKSSFAVPELEAGSEYLAVVDLEAGEVTGKVELGGFSTGVAVSPDGSLVYATVSSSDPAAVTGGKTPSASGEARWDGVAAITTADLKLVKRMTFGKGTAPSGVAFVPDGTKAYVICGASDMATPIDTATHTPGKGIPLDIGG